MMSLLFLEEDDCILNQGTCTWQCITVLGALFGKSVEHSLK